MMPTLVALFDQLALLAWIAAVQFAIFGTALLVPMVILRRRPAARHFCALTAVIAVLLSPVAAACSYRLAWNWTPVPAWLFLVEQRTETALVNDRSQPIETPPRGDDALFSDVEKSPANSSESSRETTTSASHGEAAGDLAERPPARVRSSDTEIAEAHSPEPTKGRVTAALATSKPWNLTRLFLRTGLVVWFLGILVISVWIVRMGARLQHLMKEARPVVDRHVLVLVEKIAAGLNVASPPSVLAAQSVTNPFVASAFNPRIVVPTSLLAPAQESLLAPVLVHECSHVARHDLWIGLLQAWAKVLFWPHPLVHFYSAILSRSREELCDNLVLVGASPIDYARTLLTLGEYSGGFPEFASVSLFSRRDSLRTRIAHLLDPHRDRSVRLSGKHRAALAVLNLALAATALGVRPQEPRTPATSVQRALAALTQAPAVAPTADEVVRKLAACSTYWVTPSRLLESLEYDLVSGAQVTRFKVARGEKRRYSVWMGATLHAGFRELMKVPERFAIEVSRSADAKRLTLTAKVKDNTNIFVEAGNGVENSWHGYFSHGAIATTIIVDPERFVPLEEQTGQTAIRYSDWQAAGAGQWVPCRIDVVNGSTHYRMHFDWIAGAVWLLKSSESIGPEGTVTLTCTDNVKINRQEFINSVKAARKRASEAVRPLMAMLDHNRVWLDGGTTGVGWHLPFNTLSYTFHTIREDVRESCVVDRNGEVVFEVAADVLGKMKGQLGARKIGLNTREYGTSQRGSRFAFVHGRGERERGEPYDLALKNYARIGCQFDLPLFHYRAGLESAAVALADGTWNGKPCRVATVSNLSGGVVLGCGTMMAFTSWSYVHHVFPVKEVLYIDPERNVPVHETLTSFRDPKVVEIDFADYVEVEPGQWAPRSIRIESKDFFTCEYQFQLVAGKHWMLKEVVSWFKPEEKSRGVVEDVQIDGNRELLDDSLRQVHAARTLFGGAGEAKQRVGVVAMSFALGRPIRIGPYEARVTMKDQHSVAVSVSTNDATAPGIVPCCFLDAKHRPLFAPSITLVEQAGVRRGSVTIHGTRAWRAVRFVAVPVKDASAAPLPINVVPFRWDEPMAVNVPAADEMPGRNGNESRDARTRAFRVRGTQAANGSVKMTLDVASTDGPHEFYLDLAVVLLGEMGELISSGHCSANLRVEYQAVEKGFGIEMGKIREGAQPKFIAIGVASGNVLSAPMGLRWGQYMNIEPPFDVGTLLTAPDEGCRRTGLAFLGRRETDRRIHAEFLDDRIDDRLIDDGPYSRRTLLKPNAEALVRILQEPGAADVRAIAARFLAYSEAEKAIGVLTPLAKDPSTGVADTVAVGLTFLGRAEYLDRLRSLLKREVVLGRTQAENDSWLSFHRLEGDALIALARCDSRATVDLLGETLLSDIRNLRPKTDEKQQTSLEGRLDRVAEVCRLLGHTDHSRAAHWLTAAVDLIAARPDLSQHFDRDDLARSMLKFKEQTRERIATELATGSDPAAWAYVVKESRDPYFVPAIRALCQRKDVPAHAAYYGFLYLWNVGTPAAVDGLRDAYTRGITRAEPRYWLRLCEALAARGDGRGLIDAYDVLVGLKRPAQPPKDEKERRDGEHAREKLEGGAEAVFTQASPKILTELLLRKTQVNSSPERQVVLELLGRLPDLPAPFAAILPQWAKSADTEVVESAKRLLERN